MERKNQIFCFSRGAYFSGVLMYEIAVNDDKYMLKGYARNDFYWMDDVNFEIPEKEIYKLIKLLNPTMKWKEEYKSEDVILDGYGWGIYFQYRDICIKTGGYEKFPNDYRKVIKRCSYLLRNLEKSIIRNIRRMDAKLEWSCNIMDQSFLNSNLYINKICISKEIPNGNYLRDLPVISNLKKKGELKLSKPVTFIVGENGVGKSTLIEGIAVALGFNPEGGTVNFNFTTKESHSDLHEYLTVSRGYKKHRDGFFLRAESFYNVASNIDDLDSEPGLGGPIITRYGGVSLHKQSHGESFMALIENRFCGNGIYILDEPEAALSPTRLMRLMYCMKELVDKNSQFIISTHSPILMTYPGAEVLEITEDGIESVDYKDTEHFIVTKRFMDAPERMIEDLLGEV